MLRKSRIAAVLLVCIMMLAVAASPGLAFPIAYRCSKCGKVVENVFGKWLSGSCSSSSFFSSHAWTEIYPTPDIQKQAQETQRKLNEEAAQQWWFGHSQGWW